MRHEFHEPTTGGQLLMTTSEPDFARYFFRERDKKFNSLVWNRGKAQHGSLFLESKRLILYTDKPAGEIGFELGFEEPAHFSRFFKKMAGITVSDFRKSIQG